MSFEKEIRKEYQKVNLSLEQGKRRLQVLEKLMKECNIWYYPSAKALDEMIVECVESCGGKTRFENIYDCLLRHSVEIPKQKLSQALTKHKTVKHSKITGQWELTQPDNDNAMDLAEHLKQRETKIG